MICLSVVLDITRAPFLPRDNGMKSRKTAKIGAGSHRWEGHCLPVFD
jgi:hypothetical protein